MVKREATIRFGFWVKRTGFQIWAIRHDRLGPGFCLGWDCWWDWRWPHLWVVDRQGEMKNWFSMKKVTEGVS